MKVEDREEAYRYWLHGIRKIGDGPKLKLMDYFKSAKAIYLATESQLKQIVNDLQLEKIKEWKKNWQLTESYERMVEKNIRMVTVWDREYPRRLRKIQHPPLVLYYLGRLPDEEKSALAIIGARECSDYGSYVAGAFGGQIGASGINIVSGMARGIDGIGQKAAIEAGGTAFAVLGCGVDVCYPVSNRELYQVIQKRGGVISPFLPETKPQKNLFPYRNRIVAGLSDAVLVIEARQKSGTWITVDMALEQGKDIYAVPGRLTDRLSDGCNLLIRQGAGVALSPEDLAAELAVLKNRQGRGMESKWKEGFQETEWKRGDEIKENSEEDADLQGLMGFLDLTPRSPDEILDLLKKAGVEMTIPQLFLELIQLCMEGKAKQTGGNYFSRKAKKTINEITF